MTDTPPCPRCDAELAFDPGSGWYCACGWEGITTDAADLGGELVIAPDAPSFTSGQKLGSIATVLLNARPPDGPAGTLLTTLKRAHKYGMLQRFTAELPPLEDSASWDALLTLIAGALIALVSDDGPPFDPDAARVAGAELLAQFAAQVAPEDGG